MFLIDSLLDNAIVRSETIRLLVHKMSDFVTTMENLYVLIKEIQTARVYTAQAIKLHSEALHAQNVLINDLYERQNMLVEMVCGNDVSDTTPEMYKETDKKDMN